MIDILRVPIRYKKGLDRLSNEDKGYVLGTLLSMCEGEVPELREDYIGDMVSLIFRDCNMINDKAETGKQSGHLGGEYGKLGGRPKKPPQGVNVKPPTPFCDNPRKERKGIEEKGIQATQKPFFEELLKQVESDRLKLSLREWWLYKKGDYIEMGWKKTITIALKYEVSSVCNRIDEAISSGWTGMNLNTMKDAEIKVERPRRVVDPDFPLKGTAMMYHQSDQYYKDWNEQNNNTIS